MARWHLPLIRLRDLVRGSRVDRDIDDELRFHVEAEIEAGRVRGLTPEQARRSAYDSLGGAPLRLREQIHDVRPTAGAVDRLVLDARHAARALRRSPAFVVPAVLTLALGIGATTAMFSGVHAVLLRDLPYLDADRVVVLSQGDARDGSITEGMSAANVSSVAARSRTLAAVAGAEGPHGLRLMERSRALSLRAWLVSQGFFEAMGSTLVLGRAFTASEFLPGHERVVVLSHRAWQTRFAGDRAIIGRDVVLDGATHTVVGVLAPDFAYPSAADLWAPRPVQPGDEERRELTNMDTVGRLAPGVTLTQAQAEMERIAADLAKVYPRRNGSLALRVLPLKEHLVGGVERPLLLLLGAVGLVLLIASANVAGLQLARAAARSREHAVRAALGGSVTHILRLVACESLLLAALGAAIGVGFAYAGVEMIRALAPEGIPRILTLSINGPVLVFAVVVACASAVLSSVSPALRLSRLDLRASLADGSRASTDGPRIRRLRDHLVVAEVAMAVMLTIGAGLLVRSFERLLRNDLGFAVENRLAVQVWAYDDQHQVPAGFFDRTRARIRALGGVESVGLTTDLPLADDRSLLIRTRTVRVAVGVPGAANSADVDAALAAVDGDYASAMGIPLRAGRTFRSTDTAQSRPVAMVNEAFVRRYLPDREGVGQRITIRGPRESSAEIVGVLADVRRQGFESAPRPEVYAPLSQRPANGLTFVVKTSGEPERLLADVERAMWSTDPRQAVWAARPLASLLSGSLEERRFNTALLSVFAVVALCLAAVGVYAIMSCAVGQRASELGLRRALGGSDRAILGLILGRGLRLALSGAVLGVMGALALGSGLRGMLYDIPPSDPFTLAAVSLIVLAVALLAALMPALRALRVDPMAALRAD
jgi:putative ABC transport system permease protein